MLKKLLGPVLSLGLFLLLAPLAQADFTTPAKNVSNSPGWDSKCPKICHFLDTSIVLVVWVETNGAEDYLSFSRSTDGGGTWSAPVALTSPGQILTHDSDENDNRAFSMTVNDDFYVHIVMHGRPDASEDFEIYYLRSDDQGATWEDWRQLTNNSSPSLFPDVAAKGDYVHISYQDDWPGNNEIMYKRIAGGGGGAVDQTRRLTFSAGSSYFPRIGVSGLGDIVGIAHVELSGEASNIFYKYIDSYGGGSYQTRQLTFGTDANTWNGLPYLVFGTNDFADYIYLAYLGYWPGNPDVMYKTIGGYGLGSAYTARLTYSATPSIPNSVAWGLAFQQPPYYTVHVTLHDSWPGNNDVMYRKLAPQTPGFTGQRVSWGTGDSSNSTAAGSGASAYVAWMDNTSGNYEIYVKFGS